MADGQDLVLTVTCRDSQAERDDLPALRRFHAELSPESLDEPGHVLAHLADANLVLADRYAGTSAPVRHSRVR